LLHNACTAKKKKPTSDRHKPAKMMRIRLPLARQLEVLARRRASDPTEQANRVIQEALEREGLWPIEETPGPGEQEPED
jgi:hypothetical protein